MCSLLVMDIHIKAIFPEWWNGEVVIEEHIQRRSNPKGGRWVCGNTGGIWDLSHLQLHILLVGWVSNKHLLKHVSVLPLMFFVNYVSIKSVRGLMGRGCMCVCACVQTIVKTHHLQLSLGPQLWLIGDEHPCHPSPQWEVSPIASSWLGVLIFISGIPCIL